MYNSNIPKKEEQIDPVPLEEMFAAYCKMDPVSNAQNVTRISLTQSDRWLIAARILDMIKVTTTDTGLAFFKFRKRALSYEEYLIYLKDLAALKNLDFQEIKNKMEKSGKPVHIRKT